MYGIVLLLHVLGATIWTGGHLVLSHVVLPAALRERSPERLLDFEGRFERVGMPALLVQAITGLILVHHYLPNTGDWFAFTHPVSHVLATKLTLLVLTLALALHARLRLVPALTPETLPRLAMHIRLVTLLSVLFVAAGVALRAGWFH